MKKQSKLFFSVLLLILLVLIQPPLWAFGLGKLLSESALYEQLEARIELINFDSEDTLSVALGNAADYSIVGIDKVEAHDDLLFEIVKTETSQYIRVYTNTVIVSPYINFVLQVKSPKGKWLREYTLLLDLPNQDNIRHSKELDETEQLQQEELTVRTTTDQRAQMADTKQSESVEQTAEKSVEPLEKASHKAQATAAQASDYRILKGDTLWSLAGKVQAANGMTRQQAMRFIRESNPDAFVKGSKHTLKSGSLIRLFGAESASDNLASNTGRETETQLTVGASLNAGQQVEQTPITSRVNKLKSDGNNAVSEQGGRLSLSNTAESKLNAQDAVSDGTVAKDRMQMSALQNENRVLKEELDKVLYQNQDLSERVSSLEEQLRIALLEIKNVSGQRIGATNNEQQQASVDTFLIWLESNGVNLVIGIVLMLFIVMLLVVLLRKRSDTNHEKIDAYQDARVGRSDPNLHQNQSNVEANDTKHHVESNADAWEEGNASVDSAEQNFDEHQTQAGDRQQVDEASEHEGLTAAQALADAAMSSPFAKDDQDSQAEESNQQSFDEDEYDSEKFEGLDALDDILNSRHNTDAKIEQDEKLEPEPEQTLEFEINIENELEGESDPDTDLETKPETHLESELGMEFEKNSEGAIEEDAEVKLEEESEGQQEEQAESADNVDEELSNGDILYDDEDDIDFYQEMTKDATLNEDTSNATFSDETASDLANADNMFVEFEDEGLPSLSPVSDSNKPDKLEVLEQLLNEHQSSVSNQSDISLNVANEDQLGNDHDEEFDLGFDDELEQLDDLEPMDDIDANYELEDDFNEENFATIDPKANEPEAQEQQVVPNQESNFDIQYNSILKTQPEIGSAQEAEDPAEVEKLKDDEFDTKLELVRVYIEMGDTRGASSLLNEIKSGGDKHQQQAAQELIESLD